MGCASSSAAETNPVNTRRQSGRINSPNPDFAGENGRPLSKPVALPGSFRYGKPITQNELERMRDEFWGTRVEGNEIMWQTLHSAADAILNKDVDLANAILDASNIKTPNANLDLCYDERGYAYNVPSFCYAVPSDLVTGTPTSEAKSNQSSKKDNIKPGPGSPLKLKCRINPGDYNIVLDVNTSNTVSELKKQIYQYSLDSNGKIVPCDETLQRVMFMGKELQGNMTLKQAQVDDVRVVQIFVRPKKQ